MSYWLRNRRKKLDGFFSFEGLARMDRILLYRNPVDPNVAIEIFGMEKGVQLPHRFVSRAADYGKKLSNRSARVTYPSLSNTNGEWQHCRRRKSIGFRYFAIDACP